MNLKDVAQTLSISPSTIRIWQKAFNIKVPFDDEGNKLYDDNLIEILKTIKELRRQNKTEFEIRRAIDDLIVNHSSVNVNESLANSDSMENLRSVIKAEIQEQSDISRDYAKATYQIGKLEAEKKALEDKIKLLPEPESLTELKLENMALKQQLQNALKENELLKMPWYKRLFFHLNYAKIYEINV